MSRTFVYSVTSATATRRAGPPTQLVIEAAGMVTTPGWTDPGLDPKMTIPEIEPPKSGILELDFMAEPPPPGTFVPQVLTPSKATLVIENPPGWITHVRVQAKSNDITIKV